VRLYRPILLAAVPGLVFCIVPVPGISLRLSFQLASIWLAAAVFTSVLTSWWWRAFFVLALAQAVSEAPALHVYMPLLMIAVFLAAAQGFSKIRHVQVMNAMRVAALMLTAWIVLQRLGAVTDFNMGNQVAGPLNADAAGVFLALCLPAFIRYGLIPLAAVVVIGLFLCASTTAMIAASTGIVFFIFLWRWPGVTDSGGRFAIRAISLMVVIAGMMVFFQIFDPIENTLQCPRWQAWKHIAWSFRSEAFGRGLGSFQDIFPLLISGDARLSSMGWWKHAHNEYLQAAFEMGLQVMVLIVAYLLAFGYRAWQIRKSLSREQCTVIAGITTLAVSCLGWHTFHVAPLALLGVAWLGLAHREII